MGVDKINQAIYKGDPQVTLSALKLPQVRLQGVESHLADHYQHMLGSFMRERDNNGVLSYEEIQATINLVNSQSVEQMNCEYRSAL